MGRTLRSVLLALALAGSCAAALFEMRGVVDVVTGENPNGVRIGDEWGMEIDLPFYWNHEFYSDDYSLLARRTRHEDGSLDVQCFIPSCSVELIRATTPAARDYAPDGWEVTVTSDMQVTRAAIISGLMFAFIGYTDMPPELELEGRFLQDFDGTAIGGRTLSAAMIPQGGDSLATPEPSTWIMAAPSLLAILALTGRRRSAKAGH